MRELTVAQRLWYVRQMTSWEVSRSRAEIAKANPEFTDEEVNLKWVELSYGAELAANLREDMRQRRSSTPNVGTVDG
jgi:hypothetical protein